MDVLLGVRELRHASLDVAIFVNRVSDLYACGHQPRS